VAVKPSARDSFKDKVRIYDPKLCLAIGTEKSVVVTLAVAYTVSVFVKHKTGDKAYGVRKILEHWGAEAKDAIVFGDGINDLSMFVDDWYKVAMGNACDELKARADYITTDVDKDGIWNACKELGLF
jgi:hydroxymethylpyrimidine pyrophosphatase-like HAD family hydrolase